MNGGHSVNFFLKKWPFKLNHPIFSQSIRFEGRFCITMDVLAEFLLLLTNILKLLNPSIFYNLNTSLFQKVFQKINISAVHVLIYSQAQHEIQEVYVFLIILCYKNTYSHYSVLKELIKA